MNSVTVTLELDSGNAWALALFVKRVGWAEIRQNAVDDTEAYDMRDAIAALQRALAEAGISPR